MLAMCQKRWFKILLVAVVAVASLRNVAPASAGVLDDITIPIAAGRTSGQVGGGTVDQLYRLVVPANALLILELEGVEGSELGLYVFDIAPASLVEATPIAQSAKPGGYQAVRPYFLIETNVFINVNGRNPDREYSYTLDATVIIDSSPPRILSVTVPQQSRSTPLCIGISAIDLQSGIRSIDIEFGESGSGGTFSRAVDGEVCGSYSVSDGPHLVMITVTNRVGLTARRSASVFIDNAAPIVTAAGPDSGFVTPIEARLTWRFDEPVRVPKSGAGIARVYLSTGEEVPGSIRLSATSTKLIWDSSVRIQAGSVLVASITRVSDRSGNRIGLTSANVFRVLNEGSIEITSTECGSDSCRIRVVASRNLVGKRLAVYGETSRGWEIVRSVIPKEVAFGMRFDVLDYSAFKVVYHGNDFIRPVQSATFSLN
jgi:hypothetical protein